NPPVAATSDTRKTNVLSPWSLEPISAIVCPPVVERWYPGFVGCSMKVRRTQFTNAMRPKPALILPEGCAGKQHFVSRRRADRPHLDIRLEESPGNSGERVGQPCYQRLPGPRRAWSPCSASRRLPPGTAPGVLWDQARDNSLGGHAA